jgi:hypothetical protein
MGDICGFHVAGVPFPDAGNGTCCTAAAMRGYEHCTCWEPVYDLTQEPVDKQAAQMFAIGIQPVTRQRMCGDCAYRPESPEMIDPGGRDTLDGIARRSRFWCHVGMRRPKLWRHPSGVEVPGDPADYAPPIRNGVPYRADGSPGELCAGWAARQRALTPLCGD